MTRYIRFLDEIGAQDLPLTGGKGANLGEMARAGLPAAPGFCLTADAYRDFIAAAGLDEPIEALLAGLDAGAARIIRGPEDFYRLGKGEILAASATDPAWTPLFALASAVVTEVGGILSHGAIVAREYGIPAVMGVRGITAALSTGQLVQVDGNRGQVQAVT